VSSPRASGGSSDRGLAAEQRTLHQVQRVHLEIPVVPVHRPLRGEQMQLVGQKQNSLFSTRIAAN
jgi:hypothetical protein